MKLLRHILLRQFVTGIIAGLMLLNPALALQYQQLNQHADYLQKIRNTLPKALHIHVSEKDALIARLKQQGYDVIPATIQQAENFLLGVNSTEVKPIQLAANFNIDKVYESDCSRKTKLCYREECDKYPKERRADCPEDRPTEKVKETQTRTSVQVNVSRSADFRLPRINTGGSGRDAAGAMLIIIGVVVIAALFVYAGKWIADALRNNGDYYAYWWDIGFNLVNLSTRREEHGEFQGLKFSGGFVPNMHTNFGLAFEIGQMDLGLVYNRGTNPQRIDIEGTYWLIGPTVRWFVGSRDTETLVNNSYIYLELLGGGSDRKQVDKMFVGRIGINAGVGDNVRLGFHYGAFYLGLDADEGIANDGDNYWNMYGFELGYQF